MHSSPTSPNTPFTRRSFLFTVAGLLATAPALHAAVLAQEAAPVVAPPSGADFPLLDRVLGHAFGRRASDLKIFARAQDGSNESLPSTYQIIHTIHGRCLREDGIGISPAEGEALFTEIRRRGRLPAVPPQGCHNQDGWLTFTDLSGQTQEVRFCLFTQGGQPAVIVRLPSVEKRFLTLDGIGLSERDRRILVRAAEFPGGLVLVAGATCSGRSTTLAALSREVARPGRLTFDFDDQGGEAQHHPAFEFRQKGLAHAIRAAMREGPLQINAGDLRDEEQVGVALQAAQTGPSMLGAVHAASVTDLPARLGDMAVSGRRQEIASMLSGTVCALAAQRLVPQLCPDCCFPDDDLPGVRRNRKGCDGCGFKGVVGRQAVFEVLDVTPEVRRGIRDQEPPAFFAEHLWAQGGRLIGEQLTELRARGRVETIPNSSGSFRDA